MPLDVDINRQAEQRESYSKKEALIIGNSQAQGVGLMGGNINTIAETEYAEGALLQKIQQEKAKITPDLKIVVIFPQAREGKYALKELIDVIDFVKSRAPKAKIVVAGPTPLKDTGGEKNDVDQGKRSAYASRVQDAIAQKQLDAEFYDTAAAFQQLKNSGGIQYRDGQHLVDYGKFRQHLLGKLCIGTPKDRAREGVTANAAADFAELQQAFPQHIRKFSSEETERFKAATGKELNYASLSSMSTEELYAAEEKDPGMARMLLSQANEKEKTSEFDAQGNENFEWNVGLSDLAKANVREVTLMIHPKNLEKGGNRKLLSDPEAKRVYDEYRNSGKVEYYQRTSEIREGLNGDFFNAKGYLRIFNNDQWKENKVISDEEVVKLKENLKSKSEQDATYFNSKGISYMPTTYSPGQGETLETSPRNPNVKMDGVDWQALSQEVQLNNHIQDVEDVKRKMPNFYALIGKISEMTGVPKAYFFATAEVESRFHQKAVGDTSIGNSKTIWQFYASFKDMEKGRQEGSTWIGATDKDFFKQKSEEWLGKSSWKRTENAVADALAMASLTMSNAKTMGVNLNEKLSYRDLVLLRAAHNGGSGMGKRVAREVDAYFRGELPKYQCGEYAQKYINFASICKRYNEGGAAAEPVPVAAKETAERSESKLGETCFIGDSRWMRGDFMEGGINFSEGGAGTDKMSKNLNKFLETNAEKIREGKVTTVVFAGPVNATMNHQSLEEIQSKLASMYKMAKDAGLKVIACTVQGYDTERWSKFYTKDWAENHKNWNGGVYPYSPEDLNKRTQALNVWIRAQEGITGDKVVDLYTEMRDTQKYPQADGLHYEDSRAMTEYIKREANII